jgi:DtxR family Mn-dependent transcriptional regulator
VITLAEENYLKAIYKLSNAQSELVSTNAIANELNTKASSVTDMIKKLTEKELVIYQPYQGVNLSKSGKEEAIMIIRRHRLWEVFLVNRLNFKWDEVHEVAEQLEHIKSSKLISLLDVYLGHPKYDPHGEPIPDKDGNLPKSFSFLLSEVQVGKKGTVIGVTQDDPEFLQYLSSLNIHLGTSIEILNKISFDNSLEIKINKQKTHISNDVAKNLLIKEK